MAFKEQTTMSEVKEKVKELNSILDSSRHQQIEDALANFIISSCEKCVKYDNTAELAATIPAAVDSFCKLIGL